MKHEQYSYKSSCEEILQASDKVADSPQRNPPPFLRCHKIPPLFCPITVKLTSGWVCAGLHTHPRCILLWKTECAFKLQDTP